MNNLLDFNKFLMSGMDNLDDLQSPIDNLTKEVINYLKFGTLQQELSNLLNSNENLRKKAQSINLLENSDTKIAYILGIFKTFMLIVDYKDSEDDQNISQAIQAVKHNKNLYLIIKEIYSNNSITHGELAENVGISKSSLTNTIKRVLKYNLFYVEKQGRFKWYYANPMTRKVYKKYSDENGKKYSINDVGDALNIIINIIDDEVKHRKRLNANIILQKTVKNELFDDVPVRKDLKKSIQSLCKNINEKNDNDYSGWIMDNFRIYEDEEVYASKFISIMKNNKE